MSGSRRSRSSGWPDVSRVRGTWRRCGENLCAGVESIRPFSDEEMLRDHVSLRTSWRSRRRQGGRRARRGGLLRRGVLRHLEARSGNHGSAAALLPRVRVGGAREAPGHVPSRYRGADRRVRGRERQHLPAVEPDDPPRPGRADGQVPDSAGERQGLPGDARLLQAEPDRPEPHDSDRLLDLARGDAHRLSEPAERRMRPRAGGRRVDQRAAPCALRLPGGRHPLARRALPCRSMREARGTVPGNGVGIVVLKRLTDAIADRDRIIAVIKGSAINNDGSAKVGFTAPGAARPDEGPAGGAWRRAGRSRPRSATSNATAPRRRSAIPTSSRRSTPPMAATARRHRCVIGSVKSNIGHLDAAAGVAGLIKAALSVEHGMVAPTVHFETPNPRFDFARSPFHVSAQLAPWPAQARAAPGRGQLVRHRRHQRARGSGAGAGAGARRSPAAVHLLPVSARTPEALAQSLGRLADAVDADASLALADVAYTLQNGREVVRVRRAVVAGNRDEAIARLRCGRSGSDLAQRLPRDRPRWCSCFRARALSTCRWAPISIATCPPSACDIDVCAELLRAPLGGEDIRRLLWPSGDAETAAAPAHCSTRRSTRSPRRSRSSTRSRGCWMSWGVVPHALIGHSVGEYVAACLAGVFTLSDALALMAVARAPDPIAARRRHARRRDERARTGRAAPCRCDRSLPSTVPRSAWSRVRTEAVAALERALVARGVACKALRTSHAFHSPMMDPILASWRGELRACHPAPAGDALHLEPRPAPGSPTPRCHRAGLLGAPPARGGAIR